MFSSPRFLFGLAGAVLIAAVSAYGGALLAIRTRPAPSVVGAQQFILVDGAGHIGAKLTWERNQPAVELFDSASHLRSSLFLEPNGVPDFYLYDGKDHVRVALNLFDSGVPNLAFLDKDETVMVRTELDPNGSYNTIFSAISKSEEREIAGRHLTADSSGLHVRDIVSQAKPAK